MVMAIEREGITIPNPPAKTKILFGDRLMCFGKLGNIRKSVCAMPGLAKEVRDGS